MTSSNRPDTEVRIVEFHNKYARQFRELNYDWLEKYFTVEPFDRIVLNDPYTRIIKQHGHIFFALMDDDVVGTCALLKHTDMKYELAKMAVLPDQRGRGIGRMLAQAAIDKARALGAESIVLATSDLLPAANHLYMSLGFQHADPSVIGPLPYKRKSIVMAMKLKGRTA
ncbi:MAG: GNAT family N-acetyltransferase [Candidatus Zixiibacteriota bacterium]